MNITDVSKKINLSADTLRYYEKIGLIPTIKRKKNGIRDYGEDDLKWIEFVKCMRSAGLSIDVLIEYFSLFKQGDSTLKVRKEILEEQRIKLLEKQREIKETLKRLDKKINNYDEMLLNK